MLREQIGSGIIDIPTLRTHRTVVDEIMSDVYTPEKERNRRHKTWTDEGIQTMPQKSTNVYRPMSQVPTIPQPRRRKGIPKVVLWVGSVVCVALLIAKVPGWLGDLNYQMVYGSPRTYQIDRVVGLNDSPLHPSHFQAENLNGKVFFIDMQGGDPTKAKIYSSGAVTDPTVPVTLSFLPDGTREDIQILINNTPVYLWVNNGKDFILQK